MISRHIDGSEQTSMLLKMVIVSLVMSMLGNLVCMKKKYVAK